MAYLIDLIDECKHDFKFALRQLWKSPAFAAIAIVTLALGIGANTAIFSVVNALLLRPLPYFQPQRLGMIETHYSNGAKAEDDNSVDGETWDLISHDVPALKAAVYGLTTGVNLTAGSNVEYVQQKRVSSSYIDVLGAPLMMGRSFTANEDRPHGPDVVVLTHRLWHTAFHDDPNILGRGILLKGAPSTVVGVLAAGAHLPDNADLLTPLRPSRTGEGAGTNYGMVVRLRSHASWAQADAQLARLRPRFLTGMEASMPGLHAWLYAMPLQQGLAMDERAPASVLMIAVGFLLLMACANLAGLMIARVAQRTGELATRLALGASRWDVLRQLWMEAVVIALLGGAAGLAVCIAALQVLTRMIPTTTSPWGGIFIPVGGFTIDHRVLLFTLGASLLTSVLFGVLPALSIRRIDLAQTMAAAGSRGVARTGGRRTRQWLIVGEVALTVVLLTGSGLLIRSLIHLETLPPGFNSHNVIAAKASLDDARYHNAATFQQLLTTSVTAMRQIPGVENAAVGLSLPYERGLNNEIKVADGKQAGHQEMTDEVYATPGYFDVLRMPLLAGRAFADSDTAESEPVAIVNESFARKYLGGPNAVGRHLATGKNETRVIVGVVPDVTAVSGMSGGAPLMSDPTIYLPATQVSGDSLALIHTWFQPSWIVRTTGPIAGLTAAMQRALATADPNLPFAGFYSMDDLMAQALLMQRIEVLLLGALAGLALLLSALGIYGLVSNLVVQRTREIGIRMALGSTIGQAMLEVGRSGIAATIAGLILGIGASLLTLRVMQSAIYGVKTYDPITLAGTAVLLIAVALGSTLVPTLRIAKIDPAETLRAE